MKMNAKTLGILGGGQLGRMSAMAAARLGIKTHIYCPEENSPASHVAARTFIGTYEDKKKLKAFAESVDVISYEFENIPVETVRYLQDLKPVYPDDRLLEIAQDRGLEKKFLNDIGIPTARWALAASVKDMPEALKTVPGERHILKTTRFGYDGKGQKMLSANDSVENAWEILNSKEIIIEEVIDFSCEISVIVARDKLGQTVHYGPCLNEHKDHILSKTTVPAPIPDQMAAQAVEMTRLLADAVDLVGVLALEMFVTKDGRIIANEIAPRTHNSGHWTIDACAVSQFENHVRTVCGLAVGHPSRHSDAIMRNLIGKDALEAKKLMEIEGTCVHLYGKEDVKDGRKMGHATALKPKT
ncbi:MAG: 5-(carboxyamino)imidazole ribonucleotide synthase [Rhodospirillales bacterium]|nr:5-(carboxyamino)imidazole ribonucleotide synthase [Rhodospirillales bacterium]